MQTTTLQPVQFTEVITKSGIEITKAEKYALGYAPLMKEILAQADIIKVLDKTKPEDAAKAKRAKLDIGKICSRLETKKSQDKESLLIETRLIDGLFNVAESTGRLTQKQADGIINHLAEVEKQRLAELVQQREGQLLPFGTDTSFIRLDALDEAGFARLLETEKLAFNARREAAAKAEEERIATEKLAEKQRLAKEKKDREERAVQKAENERLKALAEKQEAQLVKEREAAKAESDKQKAMADAERAAAQKKLDEAEAERKSLANELKAKKEAEELAAQLEKERIEAETAEKLAKEKAARLAPDKDKIRVLYDQIKAIAIPEFQSKEAVDLGQLIREGLDIVLKGIVSESKKLL